MQIESSTKAAKGYTLANWIGLILGPVLFLIILNIEFEPGRPELNRMAAAAALMAVWWMSEALPIPVTSLLPMVLFPFLGIMSSKQTAPWFMNSNIFLFLGGFFIALTIERWGLHRRIALSILSLIGSKPRRVILGFMLATAGMSMWISNTASTMMMLPIGLSIVAQARSMAKRPEAVDRFALSLMLAIAYSASIGGVATLVGTPPNIDFKAIYEITFPNAPEISFFTWLSWGLPFSAVFLFITWALLVYLIAPPGGQPIMGEGEIIKDELKKLGRISAPEKRVLVVFVMTALLWVFRKTIDLGFVTIPGWSNLLGIDKMVDDGTVAISMSILLFIIPVNLKKGEFLLDWPTALKVPWGILLLFGGGFALAAGFKSTGLSTWLAMQMGGLSELHPLLIIMLICLFMTFLTEVTSNTATTQMILPVVAKLAVALGINPLMLMIPATMSASCAFMLPVATPPNAIIYGSGQVPIGKMARAGILLNLAGVVVISLIMWFGVQAVMGIDPQVLPEWAK